MRDYSKVAPQFWIGPTGKRIRKLGPEAQVIAIYLLSSPHANMIGLYHLPVGYISEDTGIPYEGASKALAGLCAAGFCGYDKEAQVVWVFEMAKYQVGEQLKPGDRQCQGVQNAYDNVPENLFLPDFFDKYAAAFNLTSKRDYEEAWGAPCEPLGSQEQEQEREQEQELTDADASVVASKLAPVPDCPHSKLLSLYAEALPMLPQPRVWDGARADSMRARWRWALTAKKPSGGRYAETEEQALDFFKRFFDYVAKSDFLTGRDGKWTNCALDWLMKAENFAKVLEGRYENKEAV